MRMANSRSMILLCALCILLSVFALPGVMAGSMSENPAANDQQPPDEPDLRFMQPSETGPYASGYYVQSVPGAKTSGLQIKVWYPATSGGSSKPADNSGAPYPICILAPGAGGSGDCNSMASFGEVFSSWGIVCVIGGFIDDSQGRINAGDDMITIFGLLEGYNQQSGHTLENMVITERYAVGGYSDGGMMCFRAAPQDPRIECVVGWACAGAPPPGVSSIQAEVHLQAVENDEYFRPTCENYYATLTCLKQILIVGQGPNSGHGGPFFQTLSAFCIKYVIGRDQDYMTGAWGKEVNDVTGSGDYLIQKSLSQADGLTCAFTVDKNEAQTYEDVTFTPDKDSMQQIIDDNTITKWEWDFDGDGTYDKETASDSASVTHQYTATGDFWPVLRITAGGDTGESLPMQKITVEGGGPPTIVAEAGSDISVAMDEDVSFDGSGSTVNGLAPSSGVEYLWEYGDGTDSGWQTSPAATHSYTNPNEYTVTLTVKLDPYTAKDTLTVTVLDPEPTDLDVGNDLTVWEDQEVSFFGSAVDPNGGTLSYMWDFGDGESTQWASSASAKHTYSDSTKSPYTVTFSVKDGVNNPVSTTLKVTVKNAPPEVAILADDDHPITDDTINLVEDEEVQLTGAASDNTSDEEGLEYYWDIGGGTYEKSLDNILTVSFASQGIQTVRFKAVDDNDESAETTLTIDVSNEAPVAVIETGETEVLEDTEVTLDGSFSTDTISDLSDGLTYVWSVDGEEVDVGEFITHTFEVPGEREVTLTVTDNDGETDTESVTFTVEDVVPEVSFLQETVYAKPGEEVPMEPEVSAGKSDTWNLKYYWDFGDGTDSNDEPPITHAYDEEGTYTVTLTVTDGEGDPVISEFDVVVSEDGDTGDDDTDDTEGEGEGEAEGEEGESEAEAESEGEEGEDEKWEDATDSDGDGLPDWWEEENGMNPDDASDATEEKKDEFRMEKEKALGTADNESGDDGPNMALIAGIIAAVVIVAAVLMLMMMKKKPPTPAQVSTPQQPGPLQSQGQMPPSQQYQADSNHHQGGQHTQNPPAQQQTPGPGQVQPQPPKAMPPTMQR